MLLCGGFFLKLLQLFCRFFAIGDLKEQRASVKFCFLLGKMAAETVVMLKTAYKEDAVGEYTSLRVVFTFQKW